MSVILDIITAMFIGGFLLIMSFTASDNGTQAFLNYNADAITQMNLTNISNTIQFDLRKMGFEIPWSSRSIIVRVAQPNHFKFLAHLNADPQCNLSVSGFCDQIVDTIDYLITPFETINFPDTSVTIYDVQRTVKIVNESPRSMVIGKIGNQDVFRYLDQIGYPVTIKEATKMVEVTLTAFDPRIVLSPEMFSGGTSADEVEYRKQELRRLLRASYWRQTRLVSRNLLKQ